ncbi:MAG: sporulation protein YunB [Clostridiales bacterium]|nr:sporulation protein YunB [Clostridiales bacterium]
MKRKTRRALAAFVVVLVLLLVGFFYLNVQVSRVLEGLSAARVESVAASAMNNAILDILGGADAQQALLSIYSAEQGVYLLTANSARLNVVAADCAQAAQQRIAELGEQGVSIPFGTLTGIPTLANMGPKITLKFTPAGAVRSSFSSEFRSAGINQTLHRITLKLSATLRVILPGQSYQLNVVAEATIAESVIVGQVPNTYVNVENEDQMLHLVPVE